MTHRKLTKRGRPGLLRAALVVLVFTALPVSGAIANHTTPATKYFNHTITVDPSTNPSDDWMGVSRAGANAFYDFDAGEPCFDPTVVPGDSEMRWCDITLLHVDVAPSFWDTTFGGVRVSVAVNAQDYDLQVYESDPSATRGDFAGQSGNPIGLDETVFVANASGYYLVQVIYFAGGAIPFDGTAAFETFSRNAVPPDVDDPPGLQDVLASDPSAGFRSYSEPHIAQNPVNPDMLIAGSKFYNRDPDSLAEYEFKIGSFVSFDGAQDWTQLGQIKACPLAQAPESSWPLNNTCYPEDVPSQEGPEEGGDDIGEEYITSDIWMQFDDEGNAYAMVLDAPPFASGAGWGMTLHKWESVSPADVSSGNTWSDRIVINAYPNDDVRQELFLDDKNTFAVNNAGPDTDGITGDMVACWGQNIQPAKQQIVCELSVGGTEEGESWPDEPVPISGPVQPLVIGVHVVADPNDEHRFYAVWLQYASGLAGPSTMEFAILDTSTGAIVSTPPVTIALLDDVPRQFPNQQFRNLSIPIMGVGPSGELYVTYAEYLPTSDANDEDGMHADIRVIRNDLMGLGPWTAPVTVNQDNTRADQFQPYVAVNPDGQVEVAYFDRQHDIADNFYVDTYLSRSNDMGTTFTDTRVSHDMSSPELNAPVSSSGLFFGDYQGLVVDECFAYPFFQDTHLANDPSRDPEFDHGLPRSQFQEAFAWRVPNTQAFGGSGADCATFPEEPTRITGGGQVPGQGGSGVASFGLNIRADATGASGNMNVKDHGTGQQIKLVIVRSITVSGNHVTITGRCRIGNGDDETCQIDAEDNAEPGTDKFQLQVGSGGASYSGGGTLNRGNVQIHS
jgi:hypothetical protein